MGRVASLVAVVGCTAAGASGCGTEDSNSNPSTNAETDVGMGSGSAGETEGASEVAGTDGESEASTGSVDSMGSTGPIGGRCQSLPTTIELEEDSVVGVTPRALLDQVQGEYQGTIEWQTDGLIQYQGRTGPFEVEVAVRYDGGDARSVEGVFEGECLGPPCFCRDRVEVDVIVEIRSADGVLNEDFDGTASVNVSSFTGDMDRRVNAGFQPDTTVGSLSGDSFLLSDLARGGAIDSMSVDLELTPEGIRGAVSAELVLGGDSGMFSDQAAVLDIE